jgi:hypothetical protein
MRINYRRALPRIWLRDWRRWHGLAVGRRITMVIAQAGTLGECDTHCPEKNTQRCASRKKSVHESHLRDFDNILKKKGDNSHLGFSLKYTINNMSMFIFIKIFFIKMEHTYLTPTHHSPITRTAGPSGSTSVMGRWASSPRVMISLP